MYVEYYVVSSPNGGLPRVRIYLLVSPCVVRQLHNPETNSPADEELEMHMLFGAEI